VRQQQYGGTAGSREFVTQADVVDGDLLLGGVAAETERSKAFALGRRGKRVLAPQLTYC
jgi:hypothetical protein